MSLPYDIERCTGAKTTHEGVVLCEQRGSCQLYKDKGHPVHQWCSVGAVKVNETCGKKIEVKS